MPVRNTENQVNPLQAASYSHGADAAAAGKKSETICIYIPTRMNLIDVL